MYFIWNILFIVSFLYIFIFSTHILYIPTVWERLDKSFRGQVAFSSPLYGHIVLAVCCSLHRSCQMGLRLLGRWKVTDAVWQGCVGAMSLFKGHDLSFWADRVELIHGGLRGYRPPEEVGTIYSVAGIKVEPTSVYSEDSSHTFPVSLTYIFTITYLTMCLPYVRYKLSSSLSVGCVSRQLFVDTLAVKTLGMMFLLLYLSIILLFCSVFGWTAEGQSCNRKSFTKWVSEWVMKLLDWSRISHTENP